MNHLSCHPAVFSIQQSLMLKSPMALMTESAKVCDVRFEDRIAPFKDKIPEDVLKVIEEEQSKLSGLEQASSEFNVTRNYLDWLTSLPWGRHSEERLDIDHAKMVRFLLVIHWLHPASSRILAPELAHISTLGQAQR